MAGSGQEWVSDGARVIRIDDPSDPRVADFVGLRDRDLRLPSRATSADPEPRPSVFVAEGDLVVERAVRAGYEMVALLVDATRTAPLPPAIGDSAPVVYGAGPEVLEAITGLGVHRGCIAVMLRRPISAAEEVVAGARRLLVLERVVNPINLGVICRTAVALGMDAMLLDDATVDPLYRRASRVAMGEVFDFPYARIPPLPEGFGVLRDRGFQIVALTPSPDAVSLDGFRPAADRPVALVLGSEGPGLRVETVGACDVAVRIPLSGRVDSLNVGAAAAVACWALRACD
ncbi:MAG: RNA methyltransferase [Microthrixaceae bacterium]